MAIVYGDIDVWDEKEMKETPVCWLHEYIAETVKELKDQLYKPDGSYLWDMFDDVIHAAEVAKEKGQHMEDRLKTYYRAIEGLGFERDYSEKSGKDGKENGI